MKRHNHLFAKIVTFENLLLAARKAARGKSGKPMVARFLYYLEDELFSLQDELSLGTWQPRGYRVFQINDPKPRRISAADFRDRVVHHAVFNILEPILDRRLIHDTWACRKGKGSHGAVARARFFAGKYPYFLKCDIRRYFDSVDHGILKTLVRGIIKDKRLLHLLDTIIDHSAPGSLPGKGLPIGNLSSQHFANLYLGELDRCLQERLGVKAYVRYMDDMLLFGAGKKELWRLLARVEEFLYHDLALELKPAATIVAPVTEGIAFLGFRVYPGVTRLQRKTERRFRRKLRAGEDAYLAGKIDVEQLAVSVQGAVAHISHADTGRLRQALLLASLPLG